jgi:hypothetical protein
MNGIVGVLYCIEGYANIVDARHTTLCPSKMCELVGVSPTAFITILDM